MKLFSSKFNRERHEGICQKPTKKKETDITSCRKCKKHFSSYTNRYRHEKRCKNESENQSTIQQNFVCRTCNAEFESVHSLKHHHKSAGHTSEGEKEDERNSETIQDGVRKRSGEQMHESLKESKKPCYRCRKCNKIFMSQVDRYNHDNIEHHQSADKASTFQIEPWTGVENAPWRNEDGTENQELKFVYNQHRHLILKQRRTALTNVIRYNFPITNNISVENLKEQIEHIYDNSSNASTFVVWFDTSEYFIRKYEIFRSLHERKCI